MSKDTDLRLEEYKSLREEAKGFSDMNFRDIQFLSTLIAAVMAVAGFRQGASQLALFWSFAILQFVAFLFMITQASRLAYLFVLRQRLRVLEAALNAGYHEPPLAWETMIVPTSLANVRSLNFQSQLALGVFQALAFAVLASFSVRQLAIVAPVVPYLTLLLLEALVLLYFALRLLLQKYREQHAG